MPSIQQPKKPHCYEQDQLFEITKDSSEEINLAGDPKLLSKLSDMQGLMRNALRDVPGIFGEFK